MAASKIPRANQVVGFDRADRGLLLRRLRELTAFVRGDGRLGPGLGLRVRLLGRLPGGYVRYRARRVRERVAGGDELVRLSSQLAEALVERAPGRVVRHAADVVRDDLRGEIEALRLFEELDRGAYRAFVFRRQGRDATPRAPGGGDVLALRLVELRELLLDGNPDLDVRLLLGVLFEEIRQVVPAVRALEQPAKLFASLRLRRFELEDPLPGRNRRFEVAKLRFAEGRPRRAASPGAPRGSASSTRAARSSRSRRSPYFRDWRR